MGLRHCRHYSYESGLTGRGPLCALGIDLSAPGTFKRCMPPPHDPCEKREEWTDEERGAVEAKRDASLKRFAAAVEALPGTVECGQRVKVKCPNCEAGTVVVDRMRNGHAWVQCTTPNCVGPVHLNIDRKTKWPASKAGDLNIARDEARKHIRKGTA